MLEVAPAAPTAQRPLSDGTTAQLDEETLDFILVCTEVDATVRPTPGFSTFAYVHVGKSFYRDLSAHCRCENLRLFKFADDAYSVCAAHGMQALGAFRREMGR